MCIIVAKPKGVEMPSKEILKNCFINNPDGAGFALAHKGKVFIHKGYMTWEDFEKAIDKVSNITNKAVVMHFRITTHGESNAGNTHPFPISNKTKILQALHHTTDVVMFHNGIISSVSVGLKEVVSDTMKFISDQVVLMKEIDNKFYLNPTFHKLLARLSGSKLTFLDEDGVIVNIGAFNEVNGVYYSNYSYTPRVYYGVSRWEDEYPNWYSKKSFTETKYIKLRTLPEDAEVYIKNEDCFYTNSYFEFLIDKNNNLYIYSNGYSEVELVYGGFCDNYSYDDLDNHIEMFEDYFVISK